jgi:hypothetical protein
MSALRGKGILLLKKDAKKGNIIRISKNKI